MNFKEYPHIRRTDADGFIETCKAAVPPTIQWVVTEKIHGSNGAVYTDGNEVKMARRTGFLGVKDKFHGSERVLERHGDAARALCRTLNQGPIAIYGEYFGGLYPHALVKSLPDNKPVQKGVFYSPDLCFRAFDICVLTTGQFLPWLDMVVACSTANIPIAPAIKSGTLDELLAFDVDTFCTRIPDEAGLPVIPASKNIAEGVVIRPLNEFLTPKGDRVMMKHHSKHFREVTQNVGKEARKATGDVTSSTTDAADFVNEARLRSLLSKDMERKFEHKGHVFALVPLMAADIMGEIARERPMIASLPTAELKAFQRRLGDAIKELLGKHMDSLMDGSF